ncbi:MAG: glycosyltransferase [Phycisphaeraceae bacterium]
MTRAIEPAGFTEQLATHNPLRVALDRGRFTDAARLANESVHPIDDALLREIAEGLIAKARWLEASQLLERLIDPTEPDTLSLNLTRNLETLRKHHPKAYRRLFNTHATTNCRLLRNTAGERTIEQTSRQNAILWTGVNTSASQQIASLPEACNQALSDRRALALLGLGDGHLLEHLTHASQDPGDTPTQASSIYVLETRPETLLQVLMIHAWHTHASPLTSTNIHWLLGNKSVEQFQQLLQQRTLLPFPTEAICLSSDSTSIQAGLRTISTNRETRINLLEQQAHAHAQTLTDDHLLEVLGDNPPRKPRILAITSRFTNVLQHAMSDVAQALDDIGCEVRLYKEQADDERFGYLPGLSEIVDFKPDLVFLIDHNRAEFGDLFPANIPFINWIQDHLASLCNQQAGRLIGPRDFVLTASRPTFVNHHHYPDRQCIDLGKLSRVPDLPTEWTTNGPDLLYVSNASHTKDALLEELHNQLSTQPHLVQLATTVAQQLFDIYDRGGLIDSTRALAQLIDEQARTQNLTWPTPQARHILRDLLWLPINDALYRQQALHWAINAARQLGLNLEIYGKGWENHPAFAPYARGSIGYGEPLEQLTRSAAINLRLEPYPTLAHQRMLDGLFAGGFYLTRTFAPDPLFTQLLGFIDQHTNPQVQTLDHARQLISPDHRHQLEHLAARCIACYDESSQWDPVAAGRISQNLGILKPGREAIPDLNAISFTTAEQMTDCIQHFISNPEQRRAIAKRQRDAVSNRFSYPHGLRNVLDTIRQRIVDQPSKSERSTA